MSKDIAIDKTVAPARIAEIMAEADSFLVDVQSNYNALMESFSRSKGDCIDALKEQIRSEQEIIIEICSFFKTLLEMMQSAEGDFWELDQHYS